MFTLTIFLALISCTKQTIPEPTCQRVYILSDKYRSDSTFIQTDSIWPWGRYNNVFCGEELADLSAIKDTTRPCVVPNPLIPDMKIETIRYVIGNKITHPKKLK